MSWYKKFGFGIFIFFLTIQNTNAHQIDDSNNFYKKRLTVLLSGSTALYSVNMIGLNQLWYVDYPKSAFHLFNDNDEWLQIDKMGHSLSAYYESLIGINGLKWAGVSDKKSAIYGGLFGFFFQLPIEILDGFSEHWGASVGDVLANTAGATLAFSQFYFWNEQKILFKFSFHPTDFAQLRPDLLGANLPENILKDYNGATYWVSIPFNLFSKEKIFFPDWLCFSIGYGAENMLGVTYEKTPINLKSYIPYRQFYLSLDINSLKIKTNKIILKYLFTALSIIKIPFSAIEYNNNKVLKFYPLYF